MARFLIVVLAVSCLALGMWSGVVESASASLPVPVSVSASAPDSDTDSALISTMGNEYITLFRFTDAGRALLENNSSSEADLQRLFGTGKESLERQNFVQVGSAGPGGSLPSIAHSPSTGSCGTFSGGFCAVPSCGNAQPAQCERFCRQSGYSGYQCTSARQGCYCGCIRYTYFCNNSG